MSEGGTPRAPILVGPAGWSYADWEGIVYPAGAPRGFDRLAHVARYFDCVEVNSTFYRIPEPRMAERWVGVVADRPGFLFTVKAWQGFTHGPDGGPSAADAAAFRRAVDPLREAGRLGAVLFQFPFFVSFRPDSRERLRRLAEAFPDLPRVVEVRHNSWTGEPGLRFLRELGFSFCNIDQPASASAVRPGTHATGPIGYVRLHGRNAQAWFSSSAGRDEKYDYLYGEEELAEWVDRILEIRESAATTFVVTNNHFRGQAVTNALEIRSKLEGGPVDVPDSLLDAYERLGRIARRP